MSLSKQVTKSFDEYINTVFVNHHDIRSLILNHELKQHFVEKLCSEIRICELRGIKLNSVKIDKLSKDFARMFTQIALNHKETQIKEKLSVITEYEQQHAQPQ